MGDTSELCKSDDSLPRQIHTQRPRWLVNWLNDFESDLPSETKVVFAYGKKNILAALVCVVG